MRRSNVALRLLPSLLEEVRRVAESEGVALNQFINVAVAEKLSALRTEDYFRERARRADMKKALSILARAGKGNPPMPGDEIITPRRGGGKVQSKGRMGKFATGRPVKIAAKTTAKGYIASPVKNAVLRRGPA